MRALTITLLVLLVSVSLASAYHYSPYGGPRPATFANGRTSVMLVFPQYPEYRPFPLPVRQRYIIDAPSYGRYPHYGRHVVDNSDIVDAIDRVDLEDVCRVSPLQARYMGYEYDAAYQTVFYEGDEFDAFLVQEAPSDSTLESDFGDFSPSRCRSARLDDDWKLFLLV